MDTVLDIFDATAQALRRLLDTRLLSVGSGALTVGVLLYILVLVVALFYVSGRLKTWLARVLLARTGTEPAVRQAVATFARYLIVAVGLLVILQSAGIDLTTLNVLAGTVGLGLGFGLQNIANNFISGLIVLIERPIKVGDRIEVGSVEGAVVEIGARSTTVVTNDNIAIIVPNSKFISENVVNWSHSDPKVRFRIPVTVAYASDVRQVESLLVEVARANPDVLTDPPPGVRLLEFGSDGIRFDLLAWSASRLHRREQLVSELNFAIWDALQRHGIEIPYPQRDVHLKTVPPDWRGPPAGRS